MVDNPPVKSAARSAWAPGGCPAGCPWLRSVSADLADEEEADLALAGGDLTVFILFFFFPADLTGTAFFLFRPDLVVGPDSSGEAPSSPSGGEGSNSLSVEHGVWKSVSVDSDDSLTDMG